MDKTGTSVQQQHGLEPLMMTFSLFKEHIWNQTFRSWRPLGYIPDLDQGSKAEKLTSSLPGHHGRKYRTCSLFEIHRTLDEKRYDHIFNAWWTGT